MANEIVIPYTTGNNLYAFVVSATGQFWNTSGTPAFEAFASGHWSVYAIALTESGSSGLYFGSFPAVIAGTYSMLAYKRAGGSPAVGDLPVGVEYNFGWNGTVQVTQSDIRQILGTASAGAAGYVGPDWSHVNAPTTTLALTGTTISSSQVVASVTGAVASVTGAVGSVTGNVGGNVVGTVASVVGNVGGNVSGDVTGKVLGGGASAFTAVGVQSDLQTIKTQTVTCAAGVTVNVNVGTTQPLNFTGTAASALVKSDMVDIAGAAVATGTAQIGVNVVNIKGTASAGAAGYAGIDWSAINAPTTTVALTGTTISTNQSVASVVGDIGGKLIGGGVSGIMGIGAQVDVEGINGQNVTATARVTFPTGTIASTTNITAGTITTTTNLTNLPTIPNNWLTAAGIASSATDEIATAIWTDSNLSDFTGTSTPGKILVAQLGGTFTSTSSAVFSSTALANAPVTADAPTAAEVATAVWTDLLSSADFSTVGSVGAQIKANSVIVGSYASGQAPLQPTTAGRKLDVSVNGNAGIDWANIDAPTTTVNLSGTTISTGQTVGLTAPATPVFSSGTVQGAGSSTITLANTESSVNNFYNGAVVKIISGTGSGQSRIITGYVGSTNVATVSAAWITIPDGTSVYAILYGYMPAVSATQAITNVTTVTGNVNGNVTGNVGGNVVGSVGSISGITFPTNFGDLAIVATTGQVGINWGNILNKTTTNALTGTTISSSQVAASVTGAVGSVTGNVGGNVTGSVASIVGNVGGNVVGSVGSISGVTFPTNFSVLAIAATTGQVGLDWSNIKSPTTVVNLSGTTVGTLTTYTGNTPQTGDSFARIGATGSGLTSLAPSATALSTAQWTNARAAKLDNLDATVSSRSTYSGGAVASVTAPVTVGGYSSGQSPAASVWNALAADYDTVDTMGAIMNGLGGGSLQVQLAADGLDLVICEPADGSFPDVNARQALALIMDAAPAGLLTGAGTAQVTVKNASGSATRIVATVDEVGNRTGFTTFNPPA